MRGFGGFIRELVVAFEVFLVADHCDIVYDCRNRNCFLSEGAVFVDE
jgi:hypothetical protein